MTDGAVRGAGQPLRGGAGAKAQGQQHGTGRGAARQRRDQLERGAVAPVQVVEDHHERLGLGYQGEQARDRAVCAVALVRQRAGASIGAAERRQHLAELLRQGGIPGSVALEVL